MIFQSLRDYIECIKDRGLVTEVDNSDWNLEIGALTEIVAFSSSPRCLLFDKIAGYPPGFRVVTNLYVSEKLQSIALSLPEELSGVALVRTWRERVLKLEPVQPRVVSDSPMLQNVLNGADIDLLKLFPVPFWHKYDGGRYIGTGDAVITKDPERGWTNVGVYRCMVHDKNTLGIQIGPTHHAGMIFNKYWSKSKDAPVVITFGQDPSLYAAACAPLAFGKSELEYAGAIAGRPIDVLEDPQTGLPIPAQAEIAIVGHVPPRTKEMREEGPFGECTGYYTDFGPSPVIHVDKVLYRSDPILQGSPTMHGAARMHSLGAEFATSAAVWDSIDREIPNVVGVYSLYQPCQAGSSILVVSLRQSFPGHAKQAGLAALSSHAGVMSSRMIIVVDEDIDPANWDQVIFAMTSRCNPVEDAEIIKGIPTWSLDPALTKAKRQIREFTSSTMIIDATRKPYSLRNEYPRTNILDQQLKREMIEKWSSRIEGLDE